MKILVVGSGGREHALVWKLAQSRHHPKLFCAPGNPGIEALAECVDITATDIEKLLAFALREKVDLTVVGPEAPLCAGIVDTFRAKGLLIFGPTKAAAALEGDKAFAKDVMLRHSIPTAAHRTFNASEAALAYIEEAIDYPMVIKAAGLAAGKGVVICNNAEEAAETVRQMMDQRIFGAAGDKIVVEDFIEGEEASIIAVTDGHTICVLESAQDHKRAFDGDLGPNTGGMGAYSPAPIVTPAVQKQVEREVLVPIVHAMNHEGRPFQGFLYAGLMLTRKGPKVLEFNVRLGDPECQAILPRYQGDLVDMLMATCKGELDSIEPRWDPRPALCVVLAQEGYPGTALPGREIRGLDRATSEETTIFHAGTKKVGEKLVAAGGRVLNVTALGATLSEARDRAYRSLDFLEPAGFFFRRDIGRRALG